jgi:hypothetical protein
MKVLRVLVLANLICILIFTVKAQSDYGCSTRIHVQDSTGFPVKDAKVRYFERELYYSENFKAYNSFRLLLLSEIKKSDGIAIGRLEIKAKGFEPFNNAVKFSCNSGFFRVTLKKKNSIEVASLENSTAFWGFVTNEKKGIIAGAKVKAINKSGQVFETKTDNNGFYRLNLFPQIYTVNFEATNFKVFSIKDLVVEDSTTDDAHRQDIVLK